MSPLSAEAVLAIWEEAKEADPVQGPLAILAIAMPELSREQLLDMSVGERDALLLRLRELLFGAAFAGFVCCPACGERLEFNVALGDVPDTPQADVPDSELTVEEGGLKAWFRQPSTRDLLAIRHCEDAPAAARALLDRCVIQLEQDGKHASTPELPTEIVSRIGERLAGLQPAADINLAMACDACGNVWDAQLDIASCFLEELRRLASDLLDQVHLLAVTYGWSEQAILAMHPRRRQAYLDQVLA